MSVAAVLDGNEPLLLEVLDNGVLRLVLNRPAARNALSVGLMAALARALDRAAADKACRVVVIAGAGPAFCAGHDLREMRAVGQSGPRREAYERVFAQCSALMLQIVHLPNIGLFCSTPMVALTRAVGRKAAMEMLLTGDHVDAASAKALGLVNRVVPPAGLAAATMDLAHRIAAKSALTVAIGKEAFYAQAELGLADAYAHAAAAMTRNMLASDAAEGIDAFLEKRPPVWQDA
jgi:enoyl-CoA hydratase/carnithine racemase